MSNGTEIHGPSAIAPISSGTEIHGPGPEAVAPRAAEQK